MPSGRNLAFTFKISPTATSNTLWNLNLTKAVGFKGYNYENLSTLGLWHARLSRDRQGCSSGSKLLCNHSWPG